ncbi:peptidoglycan D,D-transpeptidase FtsI family protein [Brevirhabdus sp.]|uniref:peptidoglycan D,D-transpeptidase FtsI family protein n=1 Tax=Brevirhabdus sp. TaxID=2004514 RepID=UPI004059C624
MIRTPLRPLAHVLSARQRGENPDLIERDNIRRRHEVMRDRQRHQAEGRLLVVSVGFALAFSVIGVQMFKLSSADPQEPRAAAAGSPISAQRADIVDRNGRILATNLLTYSIYAQPQMMTDKPRAARELALIFPDLDEADLLKKFESRRKFMWIKKKISPEQKQAAHDIGDPGLMFGPREMRLYPNGKLAAHVLGGTRFGREGVHSAEVIGTAGIEKYFDDRLRDPAQPEPLQLSLDMTVQTATRNVLYGGMKLLNAKGASAVMMDVATGEVITMVSLPDFDPNQRPAPLTKGDQSDSPLFNRAVQGLYELGSVFKIFAASQAMELGIATPQTMIETQGPLVWGKFRIRDFHDYGKELSLTDVIVKSSNIGTARIAMELGAERQRAFLDSLGLLDPTKVELVEAHGAMPLMPSNWSELSTMTISYGHGLSTSPLQLAAAYSSIVNGGTRITPTLLRRDAAQAGPRVISSRTSSAARKMLRAVVSRGTASLGDVPGYAVGGKTGTADKPKPTGGYYKDKVIATFASVFPAYDPKYVLVVSFDEPVETSGPQPRRTAGWTAVPVGAEIIRRTAPLLGLRPVIEPQAQLAVTRVSSN